MMMMSKISALPSQAFCPVVPPPTLLRSKHLLFSRRQPSQASDLLPCQPDAEHSLCCFPGAELCYSNGLCQNSDPIGSDLNRGHTQYYVEGCTDPTFEDASCATIAACNRTTGDAYSGNGLKNCGTNRYCCYRVAGCECNNSSLIFTLVAGTVVTTLQKPASSTSISSILSSTWSSLTASSTLTTGATPSAEATPSAASDNAVAIGAGVGVGAGIPIIVTGVVGTIWFQMRKRRRNAEVNPTTHGPDGHTVFHEKEAASSHKPVEMKGSSPERERWRLQEARWRWERL